MDKFQTICKQDEQFADVGFKGAALLHIDQVAPVVGIGEHVEHLFKVPVRHAMLTIPSSVTTLERLSTSMFCSCRSSGEVPSRMSKSRTPGTV